MNASVEARRFQLQLVGLFGAAALLLAAFGVYGVVSYAAAQRTNEVGIRMALGARGADVTRLLVWQGLTPAVAGVAAGMAGGLALARLLRGLLFGVDAADPATFFAAACVVLAATAVGCYFPARRAARVDPAAALRGE